LEGHSTVEGAEVMSFSFEIGAQLYLDDSLPTSNVNPDVQVVGEPGLH
jgi:hypothetical protein